MGSRAEKFVPNHDELKKVIREYNGKMYPISIKMGVYSTTLINYIKRDPELSNYLSEIRETYKEKLVGQAEEVFEYAMDNKEEDLNNAMKAATYVCDNLGTMYGYNKVANNSHEELKRSFDQLNSAIGAIHVSEGN